MWETELKLKRETKFWFVVYITTPGIPGGFFSDPYSSFEILVLDLSSTIFVVVWEFLCTVNVHSITKGRADSLVAIFGGKISSHIDGF